LCLFLLEGLGGERGWEWMSSALRLLGGETYWFRGWMEKVLAYKEGS